MKSIKIFASYCLINFLINYSGLYAQETSIINITCGEANELIKNNMNNKDFIIIDIRTKDELKEGFINNSINYDYYSPDFSDWLNKLNKTKIYLVYCKGGVRSSELIKKMKESKFTLVYHLFEGFKQWQKEGLPIKK